MSSDQTEREREASKTITTEVLAVTPEAQQDARVLLATLSLPRGTYATQAEAMVHARAIAKDSKHRMRVFQVQVKDSMYGYAVEFIGWRVGLGKGALS